MLPHNHNCNEGFILVRDPVASYSVQPYRIPLSQIIATAGSAEHIEHQIRGGQSPARRACLCRLYLEGNCRQQAKCRSLHVEKSLVMRLREEAGVKEEREFLSEVPVVTADGTTCFAVRFPAVLRTKGSEAHRRRRHLPGPLPPAVLCPHFTPSLSNPEGTCSLGPRCPHIHVKPSELKSCTTSRLRTPCCGYHGDALSPNHARIATTAAPPGCTLICEAHTKSRCKFGRSCRRVHACRELHRELQQEEEERCPASSCSSEEASLAPSELDSPLLPPLLEQDDLDDSVEELLLPAWRPETCSFHGFAFR